MPAPLLRKPDYIKLKEQERIAKEEADKKKAEEAARKAEEKKKKDEEKRLEAEKKAEEQRLAEEARKAAKILPDINFFCLDVLLRPVENTMDSILGSTLDPLGQWFSTAGVPGSHIHLFPSHGLASLPSPAPPSRSALHRLAVPGGRGLQLQRLVLHRAAGLPLPRPDRKHVLGDLRHSQRRGEPGRHRHLAAAAAVCQGRGHHRESPSEKKQNKTHKTKRNCNLNFHFKHVIIAAYSHVNFTFILCQYFPA